MVRRKVTPANEPEGDSPNEPRTPRKAGGADDPPEEGSRGGPSELVPTRAAVTPGARLSRSGAALDVEVLPKGEARSRAKTDAKSRPDSDDDDDDEAAAKGSKEDGGDEDDGADEREADEPSIGGGLDVDALGDVQVSDEDLDAIQRDLVRTLGRSEAGESTTALARRDPMAAYMAEVRRHPLLTRDEEHALAVRWVEDGDKEAGRRLVTSNLRLVVKIAHEYRRAYQNLLDLVQEGNVGLVKAVQKFDPYRGVKLSTYSGWWIRAYILKYILNNWRLVKIGTTQNQRKLFFNLRKQRERLQAAGIDPTPERIAKELDVSTKEVMEMERRMAAPDLSLDAPLSGEDGDGTRTRLDLIEDELAGPDERVDAAEFKDLLQSKLRRFGAELRGRELEIFRDRLVADEPITLQDLGDRWGVSRERARQVEKRLILRLREYLQGELGDAVSIALGHE